MKLFKIVFSNILGLDGIIILIIIINLAVISTYIEHLARQVNRALCKVVHLPIHQLNIFFNANLENGLDLQALYTQHHKAEKWYQLYVSITDILPLLGILGTVISLLRLQLFETEAITLSFSAALTSTFWGISGAALCKLIEGWITPTLDINDRNLEILLNKNQLEDSIHA